MKIWKKLSTMIICIIFVCSVAGIARANELINLLMKNLSVTQPQAEGGTGAILKTAKKQSTPEEFKEVKSTIPEADSLMKKAPEPEEQKPSSMGSLSSLAGKVNPKLGSAMELSDSFQKLGLGKDMVGKFGKVITDFCKQKGSGVASRVIMKAVGL